MKYIIMCDGEGKRWNNYLGITKQEVIINNERLLDRTIRQILRKTTDKIYILSSNPNHESKFAERITSKYKDYFHKKYAYDFLDEPVTYIYGDTFYDEKAIDLIIEDVVENICFYGNQNGIVAVKVINYQMLKKFIDNANADIKSLYHLFDNYEEYRSFISVGNSFVNINTPNDYINVVEKEKNMCLKR